MIWTHVTSRLRTHFFCPIKRAWRLCRDMGDLRSFDWRSSKVLPCANLCQWMFNKTSWTSVINVMDMAANIYIYVYIYIIHPYANPTLQVTFLRFFSNDQHGIMTVPRTGEPTRLSHGNCCPKAWQCPTCPITATWWVRQGAAGSNIFKLFVWKSW